MATRRSTARNGSSRAREIPLDDRVRFVHLPLGDGRCLEFPDTYLAAWRVISRLASRNGYLVPPIDDASDREFCDKIASDVVASKAWRAAIGLDEAIRASPADPKLATIVGIAPDVLCIRQVAARFADDLAHGGELWRAAEKAARVVRQPKVESINLDLAFAHVWSNADSNFSKPVPDAEIAKALLSDSHFSNRQLRAKENLRDRAKTARQRYSWNVAALPIVSTPCDGHRGAETPVPVDSPAEDWSSIRRLPSPDQLERTDLIRVKFFFVFSVYTLTTWKTEWSEWLRALDAREVPQTPEHLTPMKGFVGLMMLLQLIAEKCNRDRKTFRERAHFVLRMASPESSSTFAESNPSYLDRVLARAP